MSTIIVAAVVILIAVLAIRSIVKDHQNGIGACGSKCSECSSHCIHGDIPERFLLKKDTK